MKRRRRVKLPFLVLAPAVVVVVGTATAATIAALGTAHLREQSDASAQLRSRVLSETLAARLSATPEEDRQPLIERAADRSGAELLLVEQDGTRIADVSTGSPKPDNEVVDLLVRVEGEARTELGLARFSATSLAPPNQHLTLIALVSTPETPFATGSLVASVAALAALLVGAAALVALGLARDVRQDVRFVRERIVEVAREGADPAGKHIPVRSVDQIGVLTSAFNVLVDRFMAAENAYRHDLMGALAYDRDRSAFLAALSHELRTPLNAILGFADVLLSEVDGPLTEDARENLQQVRNSGGHLRALIDDILDLSALESGELRLDCHSVDVYPIAAEVVREAGVTASSKSLEIELNGGGAMAFADPRRVRQIIGNLVGNAVKFTDKGSVSVRVDPRDGGASISVVDTGPGIAPSEHEAIFQEYWQSRDARRRRVGTGLGLAITRRLVQMHRGFIDLQSQLGKGSMFRVVLPSQPPPPSQKIDPPRPPMASESDADFGEGA